MIKFSTGKAHLIKRFFQALAQKFFKLPKNLVNNSKKIGEWMTLPRQGCVIHESNYWGHL